MTHLVNPRWALALPLVLVWGCGGAAEPPANPPKIEAVHPTVEKPPPVPSSSAR